LNGPVRRPISRTFRHGDFSATALADAKQPVGHTVSVCLPARDEAATIGPIIEAIRRDLVEAVGLVDEVLVVDDRSSDATQQVARDAGARVVSADEVLPELGPGSGKGEALYKSVAAATGDLIAWCDADIRDFAPHFVVGLVGPLLTRPEVSFVKGFYDRPVEGEAHGGGRVTELMARPLLNLFWPDLAGLVQPLSGEYAGRRTVLEQIPFFTGYGVEIGLLIDILALAGGDAIAQVDVGRRVHRNQELHDLSRMAYAIASVALGRLVGAQRATFADVLGDGYVQFGRDDAGRITLEVRDVGDVERPPMASLPR
jgi:glucosyl-3-phosphoglycerate synthase